eukprot:SAG25_NODE_4677_length_769_cov_0.794030_1_plen_135_part_10
MRSGLRCSSTSRQPRPCVYQYYQRTQCWLLVYFLRKYASTQPAGRAALSTTAAATQHQHNTRVTDCSYQDPATPSSTCYPPAHYRRMATAVQCPAIIGHGAAFREPATGSSTLSDPPSFLGTSPQLTWGHIEPEQ